MKSNREKVFSYRSLLGGALGQRSSARWRNARLLFAGVLSWLLVVPAMLAQETQQAAPSQKSSGITQTEKQHSSAATSAASTVPAALITKVSVTQVAQYAAVRIEGQGQFDAQPFNLQSPDRLVLDFARTRLATQRTSISGDLPPVRAIRVAQRSSDVVRVTIELQSPAPYQITRDGNTLMINFAIQAKTSAGESAKTADAHSRSKIAPTDSRSTSTSLTTSEPGYPTSARSQGVEKSASPDDSKKELPSKGDPSALISPVVPAPAASKPATKLMTPFGAVDAPQTPTAANTLQAVQNQEALPSTQLPQQQSDSNQDSLKTQKRSQQPASTERPDVAASKPTEQSAPQQSSKPPEASSQSVSEPLVAPEDKESLSVALNLESADLYQVLRIIGSELKINYVVDPGVKGTVTINTSGSISRADLFSVLESILQVNGAAIVKEGSYYRIVPAADAKVHPVPLQFAKAAEVPPSPGETLILQVFPMHYISAVDMSKVIAPFISPVGQVIVNEKGHILLVLETPPKLKQISDILGIFDNSTFSRQRVRLYSVVNNSVKTIIPELQDVFSGYSFTGSSAIRFVPIESLNAILAVSPSPEAFTDIESWLHQLDQPAQLAGEQNFVYPVQNAMAGDLRDILIELYGGSVQKPQEKPASIIPPNPMVSPAAIEEAEKNMTPQVPERIQGRLHIMSDQKNNSLIIQASPHDYEIVKRTIAQLDILPRQVLIDAKIYSVDLTGNLSLGISYYLNQQSQLPGPQPLNTNGSFAAGQSPGSLVASTFAILSQTRGLQIFLNATDQRSRVRMLSAPSILVTDNTSARIQVGASVPIPIGSALTPVQSNGSSLFAQTIQYQDTGVILTVTPHINASGVVGLVLTQEVSSAIPNTTSGIVAPVINKSSFQTSVVLADGEPLALGGIITTTSTVSTDRIPVLGGIPVLGALFGTTNRKTERSEIVLILTPHVLQNQPQAAAQSQEFINRMRETKKEMDKIN